MNRLYLAEIESDLPIPAFGGEFPAHIARCRMPKVRDASLSAWSLLARALRVDPLPKVTFGAFGKPTFADCPLHFSLSHSGNLVATLISDAPCGVDVQAIEPISDGMIARCLTAREIAAGMDFYDVWTRKECLAKLRGDGLRLREIDTRDFAAENWRTEDIFDAEGKKYRLAALCADRTGIKKCF